MGESRSASDLRLDADASWRNHGEKTILNAGPLWPRLPLSPAAGDVGIAGHAPTVVKGATKVSNDNAQSNVADAPLGPVSHPEATPAASSESVHISIDDFMKVELRVARVVEAERVPKSKKLVKLRVDMGTEQRTVVAGIAESYEPETLVGRTVVVVANLKPATLMGIESNGMVLAASPDGGGALLVDAAPATPGTRVR
jgi:methionyl-tRNA synthetase